MFWEKLREGEGFIQCNIILKTGCWVQEWGRNTGRRAEAKARKSKASGVRLFWVDPLAVSCVPGHIGMERERSTLRKWAQPKYCVPLLCGLNRIWRQTATSPLINPEQWLSITGTGPETHNSMPLQSQSAQSHSAVLALLALGRPGWPPASASGVLGL